MHTLQCLSTSLLGGLEACPPRKKLGVLRYNPEVFCVLLCLPLLILLYLFFILQLDYTTISVYARSCFLLTAK